MYCKNCGKPIDPNSTYCPECGANQNDSNTTTTYTQQNRPVVQDAPSAGFAVLSFFFPVVGLILYLVWMDQFPLRAKSCGKGALIAVIVEAASVVLYIVVIVIMALVGAGLASTASLAALACL